VTAGVTTDATWSPRGWLAHWTLVIGRIRLLYESPADRRRLGYALEELRRLGRAARSRP